MDVIGVSMEDVETVIGRAIPVGAENSVMSCDLHILMNEATESVPSAVGRMVGPKRGGV